MIAGLRPHLAELVPVVRRVVGLDADAIVRLRADAATVSVYATLPFKVLVSRTVSRGPSAPGSQSPDPSEATVQGATALASTNVDLTVSARELLAWFENGGDEPAPRDAEWRGALPPQSGWRRLDRVPDDIVRPLIRSGALALKEAAVREGVPGAEPRAEVSDALLDSVVLTVSDDEGRTAAVQLRTVSSLVRMGFVPRGSSVAIDVTGRWTRVSGEYGAAYAEAPGGLELR